MTVNHPALRALLARWSVHRGRAAMPSRDDLPFLNLARWRGNLHQVEIAADEGLNPVLDHDCRRAAIGGTPVSTRRGSRTAWQETLILPFAGRDQRVALLLVVSYQGASAEEADEGRNQQRKQRRAHEDFARCALEKA